MRCKGIELNPRIAHINILAHEIARRFRVLGIPISSHFDFACALSTSLRVGLLMTCIVSAMVNLLSFLLIVQALCIDLQLLALSNIVLIALMPRWIHILMFATSEQLPVYK